MILLMMNRTNIAIIFKKNFRTNPSIFTKNGKWNRAKSFEILEKRNKLSDKLFHSDMRSSISSARHSINSSVKISIYFQKKKYDS
jgi:hypothetical protein